MTHEIANEASIHGGLPSRLTGLVAWEPWFGGGFPAVIDEALQNKNKFKHLQTVGGFSIFGVEFDDGFLLDDFFGEKIYQSMGLAH